MSTGAAPIRPRRVLPGFTLSLGTTLLYLVLIVLIPVAALILKGAQIGPQAFWAIVTGERALAAFRVTLTAAAIVVLVIGLPAEQSVTNALHLAGATGRLTAIDFATTFRGGGCSTR